MKISAADDGKAKDEKEIYDIFEKALILEGYLVSTGLVLSW
jgi:hypothetical protein